MTVHTTTLGREHEIDRREFLKTSSAFSLALLLPWPATTLGQLKTLAMEDGKMAYTLPELPYEYDALEPHYDEETVTLHHDKHHAGYVNGLNAALDKLEAARAAGDFAAIKALSKEVAFHGSGHLLHSIFWTNMKPGGGGLPSGEVAVQIEKDFGSYDAFRKQFLAATNSVEGSGWGILGWHKDLEKLLVLQAEIHQNLTVQGITPILVCDVWEHAYYLKYQNKRPEWSAAFMEYLVNWDDVNTRFLAAK